MSGIAVDGRKRACSRRAQQLLGDRFRVEVGNRSVLWKPVGHDAWQRSGRGGSFFIGFGHGTSPFRFLSYATPSHGNCPDFALSGHTSAPTWLLKTCGAGLVMLRPTHVRKPPCPQSLSSTTTATFSHRCLSRSRPRDTGLTLIRTALL